MKVQLTVAPSAVNYIRNHLFGADEKQLVVVIVPELAGGVARQTPSDAEPDVIEAIIKDAQKHFSSLPTSVCVQWSVAAARRSRFRKADIHTVSGLPFYLPSATNAAIGRRTLVLVDGQLDFDPPLEPFQVSRG